MPEHEARTRSFYDYEAEEPRLAGRRRRQVADWGVGEDSFERVPGRRRFVRAETSHARGEAAHARTHRPSEHAADAESRAHAAGPPSDQLATEEHPVPEQPVSVEPTPVIPPRDDGTGARAAADGRRTIVIGAHRDPAPRPARRRPPRTAVERVGASPDRIVAYAVALGVLLILIAILSAGH